jgi:hypothetical protein
MDQAVSRRIDKQLRSLFPEGAIKHVQVLEHADAPEVEPGETAVRVFFDRGDRPDSEEADIEALDAFDAANSAAFKKLHDKLPRFISWVEFRPASRSGAAPRHAFGHRLQLPPRTPDEASDELTHVMTRLGPADLLTVDTLITAGIANSRAELLRWAIGRIRENPAYTQIQEHVREIGELKAQF